MQRNITYLKEILAAGIACIMLLITINNALFLHYHTCDSGSLVSHAHPFRSSGEENSPIPGHTHTGFEMILLDSLMTLALANIITFCIVATVSGNFIAGGIQSTPVQSFILITNNKAPPVF
jgi:hypothetical protein